MTSQASQMWCKATLQYPNVPSLGIESVGEMLVKAAGIATTAPFQWQYIDKPVEGSIYLVYMPAHSPPPPDGYMYMDAEQSYQMLVQGRQLDIWEHKYGFAPGVDGVTCRLRRRFRLGGKGPNDLSSSLWLLFYTRSEENQRVQANIAQARPQPQRQYPLPQTQSKPFNLFQSQMGVSFIPLQGLQQAPHQPYPSPGSRPPMTPQQQAQAQRQQQAVSAQQMQMAARQQASAYSGMRTISPQQQQQSQQQQSQQQQQQQQAAAAAAASLQHGVPPGSLVPQKRAYAANTLPPHVLAQQGLHGQLPADASPLARHGSGPHSNIAAAQEGTTNGISAAIDPSTGKPIADATTTATAGGVSKGAEILDAAGLAAAELDALTPRQIALARYRQHHEWMEEIVSAVPVSRIKPVDLFPAPASAEDVQKRIDDTQREIARMKQAHAQRMQRATHATTEGSDWAVIDQAIRALAAASSPTKSEVDAIQSDVEKKVGLRAVPKLPPQPARLR